MFTLFVLRSELHNFIDVVNALLCYQFEVVEDEHFVMVVTHCSFVSDAALGYLPARYISFLSIDCVPDGDCTCSIRLKFDKSNFS